MRDALIWTVGRIPAETAYAMAAVLLGGVVAVVTALWRSRP